MFLHHLHHLNSPVLDGVKLCQGIRTLTKDSQGFQGRPLVTQRSSSPHRCSPVFRVCRLVGPLHEHLHCVDRVIVMLKHPFPDPFPVFWLSLILKTLRFIKYYISLISHLLYIIYSDCERWDVRVQLESSSWSEPVRCQLFFSVVWGQALKTFATSNWK